MPTSAPPDLLLTPDDLGLPTDKFPSFRKAQLRPISAIAESQKRFSILSAPTGTGKSLIYIAISRLMGARTLVLVGTKGLQQQLMHDFAVAGMVDIRGQSNYPCVALQRGGSLQQYGTPGATCDQGPCHAKITCREKLERKCHYFNAVSAASKASLVVGNYAYWLNAGRNTDPNTLGRFDLIILDEAHTARDWLADFCSVEINLQLVRRYVPDVVAPSISDGIAPWATWAAAVNKRVTGMIAAREEDVAASTGSRATSLSMSQIFELTNLSRALSSLAEADRWQSANQPKRNARVPGMESDWVVEPTPHGVKWSPVWGHHYAERYLFRGVPRIILSSATVNEDSGRYLGIPAAECDYHEVSSGFDARRRPLIYLSESPRLSHRMSNADRDAWIDLIDQIIAGRLDRKGIIHARSYSRMKEIVELSAHRGLMLTHDSRNVREVVERFKSAKAPCVLVSPSLEEGFDFPGDLCRYQIIAKVPFIDMRSPITKARVTANKAYGNDVAAIAVMQMAGRGMRSADDQCETFVVDGHWNWFRMAAKFPRWFREAFRQSDRVPAAIQLGPPVSRYGKFAAPKATPKIHS